MRIAQGQNDSDSDFVDKISGRWIKILRHWSKDSTYLKDFREIKKKQILDHNTHLVEYCETN